MEKARMLLIEKLTEATGNAVPADEEAGEERFAFFGEGWLHQLFCKFRHCKGGGVLTLPRFFLNVTKIPKKVQKWS